jgi:type II secretory pathway component PulM
VLLIAVWLGVMKLHTQTEVLREAVRRSSACSSSCARRLATGRTRAGRATEQPDARRRDRRSAREHGIALTTRRPDGPDGVQVAFSNVPFDMLLDWLVALEKQVRRGGIRLVHHRETERHRERPAHVAQVVSQ